MAESSGAVKPLRWVGRSKEELIEFPEEVRKVMGYALFQAQLGGKHMDAKPLKGHKGAGVLEVVENFDTNTFRTVYTAKLGGAIYVLHAFQKEIQEGDRDSEAHPRSDHRSAEGSAATPRRGVRR